MATTAPGSGRNSEDTARYIEQLARELRAMAGKADLSLLAYLLGMVEDDAAATVRRLSERERAKG